MNDTKLIFQSNYQSGTSTLRAVDGLSDPAILKPWQEELSRRQLEVLALNGREFQFRTPLPNWQSTYKVIVIDDGPKRAKTVELHPLKRGASPIVPSWPNEFLFKLRESFGQIQPELDKAFCIDMVLAQIESLGREKPRYLAILLLKGYLHEACEVFASRSDENYRLGFYKIVEQLLEKLEDSDRDSEEAELGDGTNGSWISRVLARLLFLNAKRV